MNTAFTELGVGGILVIMVLRTVFDFLKSAKTSRNGNGNGKYVTRSEFDAHKSTVQYRDNCGEIVKRIDENFHERKRDMDKRFDKVESCLGDLKVMVGKLS